MKKSKALALGATALVFAFGLTACGMEEGTVSQKSFEPSHSEEYSSCQRIGKITTCTPKTREVDDKWKIELTKDNDKGWVEVSHSDYDNYGIGDYYTTK